MHWTSPILLFIEQIHLSGIHLNHIFCDIVITLQISDAIDQAFETISFQNGRIVSYKRISSDYLARDLAEKTNAGAEVC